MKVLTGVGTFFSAAHADRMTGAMHGHTWEVVAWHECPDQNDAVMLQAHLVNLCKVWDHGILPPELARAEDLAGAILRLSPPTCVEVEISRENERLYAKATA